MTRRVLAGIATAVFAVMLVIVPALPASADLESSIRFTTPSPVQAAFGGNWSVRLQTTLVDMGSAPVPSAQATVTVRAAGVAEPIATQLPIQADGSVYLSAPASTPLPPGTYQLSAELVPVSSLVAGSTTTTPLSLEISSFALTASVSVEQASIDADQLPVIELTLSGEYVDATASVPAGEWTVIVSDAEQVIVQTEVAQPAGPPDPVRFPVTDELDRGREFTVDAEFVPVEAVAAGLEVTQPGQQTFRTRDDGLGDVLGREIPYPLWLTILTILVPLALAVTAIVLTVRMARGGQPRGDDATEVAEIADAGPIAPDGAYDPFAGLGQAAPGSSTPAPTQVLPKADPDASTRATPQSAPTERLTTGETWSLLDPPDQDGR